MDEISRNANRIFVKFVTDKEAKLQYGAKIRAQMQESLRRGEEPKGYRVDWILNTVTELFAWLGVKAAEFNAAHPQDAISTDDFSDVISTAQMRIKNRQRR